MEKHLPLEKDLLARARKFERQALAGIYDMYSDGIYRYALRLLADPGLAEECVAETFSRFLQALSRRKGPRDHVQAYLYRIAHNWIVDRFRRDLPAEELKSDIPDSVLSVEARVDQNLEEDRLRHAVLRLTPDQQQVIALKYLEGLDNQAVARIMQKPVGAVKSLQHRALQGLERILKEYE